MKLQIIAGSVRSARNAGPVLAWAERAARRHVGFDEVEVLDLRDWNLPVFDEPPASVVAEPTYSSDLLRAWNETIAAGDAYIFVTPEYNHGIPGGLKNAIDSVYGSFAFRHKPAGFLGYSVGPIAAARAVEHLTSVAVEMELVPLRDTVLIPFVATAFDDNGGPTNGLSELALQILLDDLGWWGPLLKTARRDQLAPGVARFVAGMQAVAT